MRRVRSYADEAEFPGSIGADFEVAILQDSNGTFHPRVMLEECPWELPVEFSTEKEAREAAAGMLRSAANALKRLERKINP